MRQMSCRRCQGMRVFVVERVRQDRRGTRWGYYRCPAGHEDYTSLTGRDYVVLTEQLRL